MMILSVLISVVLALIALLHTLWGFGIWVPIRNEEALAHAAVGALGVTRMPGPIPCFLVATGLFAVIIAIWVSPGMIRSVVLWGAAAVFLGRGLITYTRAWRRMTPVEPFASNDRRYYGPLSLSLGMGLLLVIWGGI